MTRSAIVLTGFVWAGLLSGLASGAVTQETEQDNLLAGPKPKQVDRGQPNRRFGGGRDRSQNGRRGMMRQLLSELELTEDQKPKISEMVREHRSRLKQWRSEHADEMKQINKQLRQLKAKRRRLVADAPKLQSILKQIRPLLTDEQQQLLDQRIQRLKQAGGKRGHGNRMEPHDRSGRGHRPNHREQRKPDTGLDL